ncbi:MAG: hypothetical protein GY791_03985 [Alphaproteobacteria bacterium]|nr:hypothetical protein [Alphaproteobacteria bacterium]
MDQPTPPAALIAAIQRLMRPLVRVLLAHGITYPNFCALLKRTYVDVAEADPNLESGGKPPTTSRISVVTGVHRKDVKRLRAEQAPALEPSAMTSVSTLVIGRWVGTAEYLDERGQPRVLPRRGDGPSFDGLVESVSKDVRPRTLLDEWQRLGLVTVDAADNVTLDTEAFVPREGFDELAYFFGRNLHDHMASAASNLLGERSPLFERAVFYGGLTAESVAAIEERAEAAGTEALRTINRETLARRDDDRGKPDATRRLRFGVYFYEAEDSDAGDPPPPGKDNGR